MEAKKVQKLLTSQLRRFYNYIRTDKKMNTELHHFTFQSISSATNNFSSTNKLGEGGFGAVYKVIKLLRDDKIPDKSSCVMEFHREN